MATPGARCTAEKRSSWHCHNSEAECLAFAQCLELLPSELSFGGMLS